MIKNIIGVVAFCLVLNTAFAGLLIEPYAGISTAPDSYLEIGGRIGGEYKDFIGGGDYSRGYGLGLFLGYQHPSGPRVWGTLFDGGAGIGVGFKFFPMFAINAEYRDCRHREMLISASMPLDFI